MSHTDHVTVGDPLRRALRITEPVISGSVLECEAILEQHAVVAPLATDAVLAAVAIHVALIARDEHLCVF